jgi:hypothetical protein
VLVVKPLPPGLEQSRPPEITNDFPWLVAGHDRQAAAAATQHARQRIA